MAARQRAEAYWAEVRRAPRIEEVRSLLERGDHEALERWLESLQREYEAGRSSEYPVFHVFHLLARSEFSSRVEIWARARPRAWTVLAARGAQSTAAGFAARGERTIARTPRALVDMMRGHFEQAVPDLRTVIEQRPRFLPAYAQLIDIARAHGDAAGARALVDAALARDPRSYLVRLAFMSNLEPRWGGSRAAMEAFAHDAQPHAAANPILVSLVGFAAADRAYQCVLDQSYACAIEHYGEALRFGRRRDWLEWRADAYTKLGRCPEAVADLEEILHYEPDAAVPLARRAHCHSEEGRSEAALRDYERAFELAPNESWIARAYARELGRARGPTAAAAVYERQLAARPRDPDALEQLALLERTWLHRPERARDLLARLVAIAPTRASAWREYGSTLHQLGEPGAAAAYTRYLEVVDLTDPIERAMAPQIRRLLKASPPAAMPR